MHNRTFSISDLNPLDVSSTLPSHDSSKYLQTLSNVSWGQNRLGWEPMTERYIGGENFTVWALSIMRDWNNYIQGSTMGWVIWKEFLITIDTVVSLFGANWAHGHSDCQNPLSCVVLNTCESQKTFYNNQATPSADTLGSPPLASPTPGLGASFTLWWRVPAAPEGHYLIKVGDSKAVRDPCGFRFIFKGSSSSLCLPSPPSCPSF